MPIVRILLGSVSREWKRKIIEVVGSDHNLEIVGDVADPLDLLVQARERKTDVIVLSQLPDGGEPGICSHLLLEHPNMVLVLLPDPFGPDVLCRMVMQKEETFGVTMEHLHAVLRRGRAPVS